ncbi:MAG: holo-ACP synthase [Erysipelotrichaceae bacterium]|nr:holo-ACP synthase [Erysipelotrichaceae bacterium]
MIRGIGVDMCDVNEVKRLLSLKDNAFLNHTFTQSEINISETKDNQCEYLASRFAGKEATFKALSTLHLNQIIDFRKIEILNHLDGRPYVNLDSLFINNLSIQNVFISISHESHYVIAMVMIE